jgi:hypothetical protein
VNLHRLRARIEALSARRAPAQLPANFTDPIAAMLRAQVSNGAALTATTPEAIESAKAELAARLEEAGRRARARAWS